MNDYKQIFDKIYDTLAKAGYYGDELYEQTTVMARAVYNQYLKEKKEDDELKGKKDE